MSFRYAASVPYFYENDERIELKRDDISRELDEFPGDFSPDLWRSSNTF